MPTEEGASAVIYIVVWSGGYEAPSYAAHNSEKEAFKRAIDWQKDADDDSDWIDVLSVDTKTLQVKRLERKAWTPEGQV